MTNPEILDEITRLSAQLDEVTQQIASTYLYARKKTLSFKQKELLRKITALELQKKIPPPSQTTLL